MFSVSAEKMEAQLHVRRIEWYVLILLFVASVAGIVRAGAAPADESGEYPKQLGNNVELLSFDMGLVPGNQYMVTCAFRTNARLDKDYTVFLQCMVSESDARRIPERDGKPTRLQKWVFQPEPPTSCWSPGDTVVLRHKIAIAPVPCQMDVNLIHRDTDKDWQRIQPRNVGVGWYLTLSDDAKGLTEVYDKVLAQLEEHEERLDDGYLISDLGGLHELTMELVPIAQVASILNAPPECDLVARETVLDAWMAVGRDRKTVFVSSSPDFTGCKRFGLREEVPGVRDWYLDSVDGSRIRLRYAHIYHNCDFVSSLTSMYAITGNRAYLDRARKLCIHLVDRIHEDGKVRRHFAGRPPEYNGMTQAYVMRSLYECQQQDQTCAEVNDGLVRLARSFVFTAEGTWNHWHNAMMGRDICERVLVDRIQQENPLIWQMEAAAPRKDVARAWLKVLGEQVKEFEGRIVRAMRKDDPQYPSFLLSYQPYETMLMVKLVDEYYDDDNYGVSECFPLAMAYTESSYRKNDARHRSFVMEAKYHALSAFGWVDEEFEKEFHEYCMSFSDMPYAGTNQMVHRLLCISWLLGYKSICGPGSLVGDVDRDGLPDEWEVAHFGTIHRADYKTDSDQDGLSDDFESRLGTDPLVQDSDGDSIPDKVEVILGLNPLEPESDLDSDGDGISNVEEWRRGTNPSQPTPPENMSSSGSCAFVQRNAS